MKSQNKLTTSRGEYVQLDLFHEVPMQLDLSGMYEELKAIIDAHQQPVGPISGGLIFDTPRYGK